MLPAPPPEIAQLNWFIGNWQIKSRYRPDRTADVWLDEEATSVVAPVLNGHALLESFKGILNGSPVEGISIRIYNATLGRWEQCWKDTSAPAFADYTGEYKDGMFIGISNVSFSDKERKTLAEKAMREVFFNIEPQRFSWKLEVTKDAGANWLPVWTLEYTRE